MGGGLSPDTGLLCGSLIRGARLGLRRAWLPVRVRAVGRAVAVGTVRIRSRLFERIRCLGALAGRLAALAMAWLDGARLGLRRAWLRARVRAVGRAVAVDTVPVLIRFTLA